MAQQTIIGIAFPFRKGTTSFPAKSFDDETIEDNINRILLTRLGDRVMRPDVGSDSLGFVFENVGAVLQAGINHEVRRALAEGEPRITVIQVASDARINNANGGRDVIVDIVYQVGGQIQKTTVTL